MGYKEIITPGFLCTPSRFMGEKVLSDFVRKNVYRKVVNILDVGCGKGEYRFLFSNANYTGIDICNENFDEKNESGVNLLEADAAKLPLPDSVFDLILCQYAFEYFSQPKQALAEMFRVLREKGIVYICLPTHFVQVYELPIYFLRLFGIFKKSHLSGGNNEHFYFPSQIKQLLSEAGFTDIKFQSTCGPSLFLFKIIYLYFHGIKVALISLLLLFLRSSAGKQHCAGQGSFVGWLKKEKRILRERRVNDACNREEYLRIKQSVLAKITLIDRLYLLLLNFCYCIDRFVLFAFKIEFAAIAVKGSSS